MTHLFQRKACDVIESDTMNLYLYNNERMLGQIEELNLTIALLYWSD